MRGFRKICLGVAGVGFLLLVAGLAARRAALWQPGAVAFAVGWAMGAGAIAAFRPFQYTAWIVAGVVAALIFPGAFVSWGGFDLRNKWVLLLAIQMVMFGMGTQMGLADFAGVARMPQEVLVGMVCHFSVMPLVGWALTRFFQFPPEIAAGIILVGSCSSGLASNVMAYLAKANLALSITVTAMTTLVAPFLTPLLMKLLAGSLVEVSFFDLMRDIIKMVIVPIGATLLHDYLKHATARGRRIVWGLAIGGSLWLAFLAFGGWSLVTAHVPAATAKGIALAGFLVAAAVLGVVYHRLTLVAPWLDRFMPTASMAGIVYFITVTTATGRDNLLKVGGLLFLAVAIHNAAGYCLGYGLSRAARLDKNSARSVAFEVGLQNGGMATGLAAGMGKLGTVGLAAAIFAPWMSITGSVLANYWRKRPVSDKTG